MFPFLSSLGAGAPTAQGAGAGGADSAGSKTGLAKKQQMDFQNDATTNSKASIDGAIAGIHGPIINLGRQDLGDSSAGPGNTWFMVALGVVAAVVLLLVLRK